MISVEALLQYLQLEILYNFVNKMSSFFVLVVNTPGVGLQFDCICLFFGRICLKLVRFPFVKNDSEAPGRTAPS